MAAVTLFLVSCERPITSEEVQERDSVVSSYFNDVIGAKDLLPPLPESLATNKAISKSDVDGFKAHAWQLWQEAMGEEIERLGFAELPDSIAQLIWDIPQNERMKVEILVKGEKPEKGYPLFINLHGGGRDDSAMGAWSSLMNEREWEAARILGGRYNDAPSLYVIPRMADDRKGRWYLKPQQKAFRDAIRAAIAAEVVDPNRIYLLGISEGGYGSHRLSLYMPDLFTAVGPMAAAEPMGSYAVNLRNLPIRLEVGEKDTGFKRVDFAREWGEALDRLEAANPGDYQHEVIIQEGRGHGINYYDVAPWLAEQKERSTYPKQISYKFHDLDGLAQQLYYLDLSWLHFPETGELPLIQLIREGNEFTLSIDEGESPTGSLRLFLDDKVVDLSKKVRVVYGDKVLYNGEVTPTYRAIITSIATFGDPLRVFPAYIDLDLK